MIVADDIGIEEVHPDGRRTTGVKYILCDEDVEAIRQGYRCVNCQENFNEAFPEACMVCGFPCREKQSEMFARIYVGHVPGARTGIDVEAEADRMEAEAERRAFEERTNIRVVIGKSLKKEHRA